MCCWASMHQSHRHLLQLCSWKFSSQHHIGPQLQQQDEHPFCLLLNSFRCSGDSGVQQLNDMLPETCLLCKGRSTVLCVGQNVRQVVGRFSDNAYKEDVQSGMHRNRLYNRQ